MAVEPKVFTGDRLRHQNDLPGVLPEMLHHMQQRMYSTHTGSLNITFSNQLRACQAFDNSGGLFHGRSQVCRQGGTGLAAPRLKLQMTLAADFPATESPDDPLPHIAGQMQRQITRSILNAAPAQPYLIIS